MSNSDSTFATRLYKGLEKHHGNLFFAPASIRLALAMAYAGARGETASEMQQVLCLPPGDGAHETFAAQLRSWEAGTRPAAAQRRSRGSESERYTFLVANRLWGDCAYHFLEAFLGLLRDTYRAPLEQLDFCHDLEGSRVAINRWVSEQTQEKIRDFIGAGVLTAETRLLITNAVYFKARWQEEFEPKLTQHAAFFVTPLREVLVPMMHQVKYFGLGEFESGQVLELPYGMGRLAMDVVLPRAKDGLADLARELGEGALPKWLGILKSTRVDVALPRFKVSSSVSLAKTLHDLGMAKAFQSPCADFSGMDGTHELFIGDLLHKALVEVDEQGTEAAAVSGLNMVLGPSPRPAKPVPFLADHPFVFFIRDRSSGVILFMGRVEDPSAR